MTMLPTSNREGVVLSIQYLRGIAAMAVVICHIASRPQLNMVIGAAGVDVFFVISGFVMWVVTSRRPTTASKFMADRVTRIAPPYILLTIVIYLLVDYVPSAFPQVLPNLPHFIQSVLFIPHTDPSGTAFPMIIPGWTLNYEMFFYLVFAGGLAAPALIRVWIYTAVFSTLVLIGLVTHSSFAIIIAYTDPQLLEFVAGLWLGVLWERDPLPGAAWSAAAVLSGLVMFIADQSFLDGQSAATRVIFWGLPSAMTVGGLLAIERRWSIGRSRTLLLLGNDWFAISLVNIFVVGAIWRFVGPHSLAAYFVVTLTACVASGVIFWRFVERPVKRFCRGQLRTSSCPRKSQIKSLPVWKPLCRLPDLASSRRQQDRTSVLELDVIQNSPRRELDPVADRCRTQQNLLPPGLAASPRGGLVGRYQPA